MDPPPWMHVDARNGWHRVTLNRSATRNALEPDLMDAVGAALHRAEDTAGCRAFVVAATGPDFCSGMRITAATSPTVLTARIPCYAGLLTALTHSPLATIAVVEGAATGGGVGLAAACDYVIAGPEASFRLTESLLGLVPALITPVLARRTGEHRAFLLALTSRRLNAAEATGYGIADEAPDHPGEGLRAFLISLRRAGPGAVTALKRFHRELHPLRLDPDGTAASTLRERLQDPEVHAHLARLREGGLIP